MTRFYDTAITTIHNTLATRHANDDMSIGALDIHGGHDVRYTEFDVHHDTLTLAVQIGHDWANGRIDVGLDEHKTGEEADYEHMRISQFQTAHAAADHIDHAIDGMAGRD